MPSYIVAKFADQVIIKRNRGENQRLLSLGIIGQNLFIIEAGSKKKALQKGLDLFPATTLGQSSQTASVEK